ncbi:MAG: redox-sensitive transcriptional activator SoxR [Roseobacter sp.]
MALNEGMTIGALSQRTGLAVSAIRHYEAQGLVHPWRNSGGQRRFARSDLRRLSFVMAAQQFGFTLPQIKSELDRLPNGRTPTKADWARIGVSFRAALDAKIDQMKQLGDRLDSCIGCGCLSLKSCALYNPKDRIFEKGPGPRFLRGDIPD